MEYIGQIIIFLSALVAINGNTWKKENNGLKKITLIGYITIILAVVGLIFSIINTYSISKENELNKKTLKNTEKNTENSKIQLNEANVKLNSSNNKIESLNKELTSVKLEMVEVNTKLETYKEIVGEIKSQSDRQDQTVMMEFVQLRPGGSWRSRNLVYSGSKIEFLGFDSGLILEYNGRAERIPNWQGQAIETAIMGESGKGFIIELYNSSNEPIMGKVHIVSSPRVRTKDWSWIEEKLKK